MNVTLIRKAHVITRNGGNVTTCDMCGKEDSNLHKPKYSKGRICTKCIKALTK